MEMTGKVLGVGDRTYSCENNKYSRQELTLDCSEEYNGREYKNDLKFIFENANTAKLDGLQLGEEVTVKFNPQGRFYIDKQTQETKHFQYLRAFDLQRVRQSAPPPSANQPAQGGHPNPYAIQSGAPADDLPF